MAQPILKWYLATNSQIRPRIGVRCECTVGAIRPTDTGVAPPRAALFAGRTRSRLTSPRAVTKSYARKMAGAARTGPRLGLSPPNRTLPASATLAGVARISMVIFSSCDCIDSLHQRRHQWRRFDATLCTEKACMVSGYCMTARPLAHEHSRRLCEVALHKTLKTVC